MSSKLAPDHVSSLARYVPGKPIAETERELGLRDIVKLASNESAFGTSPRAVEAMTAALSEVHRYPDGACFYLKEALARHHRVTSEQVYVGAGTSEIIEHVVRTFVCPGEEVLTSAEAFILYQLVAQAHGVKLATVPARAHGYDLEAMATALNPRTKVVFIANPNNPTGTYSGRAALERFVARLPESVILVMDEAYFECATAADYPDSLALPERKRTLSLRTFSKVYGLAGARVGYAIGDPELLDLMDRVRSPFNVNSLAHDGALAALADQAFVSRVRAQIERGRAWLQRELAALGVEVVPSQANFVMIGLPLAGATVYQRMLARGVIVRPLAGYGLPNHLRITVGTDAENQRALDALRAALAA